MEDHCRAIRAVLEKGREGEIYNIGGSRSLPNLEVVHKILAATGKPETLIRTVEDRPGHDRRYALSSAKIDARNRLGSRRWSSKRAAGDGGMVSAEYAVGWSASNRASTPTITRAITKTATLNCDR